MNKTEKEAFVATLREELAAAPSVVIASSLGVDANSMNELRAKFRASGTTYRIVKNTLAKIAIEGTEHAELAQFFVGPTAIAYNAEDAVVPAKILVDYRKGNDKIEIRGGFLNGGVIDAASVEALSKLPGKDELRGKLLSVFNGVGTKFVRVLSAAQRDLFGVLNARKDVL